MSRRIIDILLSITLVCMAYSCSTTSRLEDDEVLYTGVHKIDISSVDSTQKLPSDITSQIKSVLDVAPNNPLISPYIRTPFPIGLWVYNHWNVTPESGKIKKWLYDLLKSEPVLISSVRPELRTKMIQDLLDNNGYFGSSATYKILPNDKNPRKARISYFVRSSIPYTLSTIEYLRDDNPLTHIVDSLARNDSYLHTGNIYCADSLNMAREKISTYLRNKGYYYFRPEFIEYQADSTISKGEIALRMQYANNISPNALRKYYVKDITTVVDRYKGGGVADTISDTNRGIVVQMRPSHLRPSLVPSCLSVKKGKLMTLKSINKTQSYLSRLGMFKNIGIEVTPLDSIAENQDSLDVNINCTFDQPMEASFEVNTTYKTNSYLGPGLGFGVSHNNLFGGGEKLSVDFNASYEWQIGKASGTNSDNNYYEFGINSKLSFPRLLAPKFIQRIRRELNWTHISLNSNLYNNPSALKFLQTSAAFTYEWYSNKHLRHELALPKFTYSKRLREPDLTDTTLTNSQIINWLDITRRSEFVPQLSYTFYYDKSFGSKDKNNISWWMSLAESGNVMAGIWSLAGQHGGVESKKLFGVPFSQYIKSQTQLVYSRRLYGKNYIVTRALVGAGFVYGNSDYMPYGEDFYAGGPNTIRAFGIRTLGPGGFNDTEGYDSQILHTGSFQLVMNAEYRFPIIGIFHGAVFVDAGNVWLLKDPYNLYPNGVLRGRTFWNQIALGTGAGIRVDLDMLIIRADLGVGIHAPFDTGKKSYYNMTSFKNSLALNFAIGYPF